MIAGAPPRPKALVSRTKKDIIQSQTSKYCPVPLLSSLKNLEDAEFPLAVVGLPCHLHGLKFILEKRPWLKNKIAYTIGLICDRTLTFRAMDLLLAESQIKSKKNISITYRDKKASAYPGDVHVFSDNGHSVLIPSAFRMRIKNYFTPLRCRLCFDKMNIFSDITAGDPHGLKEADRKRGESVLVARTELGRQIINDARRNRDIEIRPVDYKHVLKGQDIDNKRRQWRAYMEIWGREHQLPNYFDAIKSHTAITKNTGKFTRDIALSLQSDNFSSTQALLKDVKKKMLCINLKRKMTVPLLIMRKILKKIYDSIKKA